MKANIRLVEIRRVSTEEQARDDRSGLDRQADSNRRTAERVGALLIKPPIVITDVCRENFIDTPEWRAIQALIADPNVHIVVDMQDRIVGALEGIPILIECKKTNTFIYHSQGVTDPSTFAGQVLATFTALAAGNELHSIRHRAQGGKEAKRRAGIFPSSHISLPTGIAYTRSKGDRGRWTYNDEIQIVREVYRLVAQDGLRNWAEVARRAGASNSVTVRNMLTNPIYKGWWIVDEKRQAGPTPIKTNGRRRDRKKIKRAPDEVIRHQVFRPKGVPQIPADLREEALVDEVTWDLVQSIIEAKRRDEDKPRDSGEHTRFIYRGRIWCADCGNRMWSRTRSKSSRASGRRDWYACKSTQTGESTCSTKYLKRETVDTGLDQLFRRIVTDEHFLTALINHGLEADRTDFAKQILANTQAVKRIEGQCSRLLELYLEGVWSRDELDLQRTRLDAERAKVERELSRVKRAQAADKITLLDGLRAIFPALVEFEAWPSAQKRELLARFFPRVEISKQGVERLRTTLPNYDSPINSTITLSWNELIPSPALNDLGLVSKPLYTRADIKQALALTDAQFITRLKSGEIPASIKGRGHKAWTEQQVREMIQAKQPGKFGLPAKPFYTTGDLCKVLGLSWDRLRRLIERGEIPDSRQRDANGHRVWSMKEIGHARERGNARLETRNDALPQTYDDLAEQYGSFIRGFVRRINKIPQNDDELQSHIWIKLLEAKFLERFAAFRRRKQPSNEKLALRNYLRVAIRNHFANYCRTAARHPDPLLNDRVPESAPSVPVDRPQRHTEVRYHQLDLPAEQAKQVRVELTKLLAKLL